MFDDAPRVTINCYLCEEPFERKASVHRMNLKRGYRIFFCSSECRKGFEAKKAKETVVERFWSKVDKTPGHGPNGDCWIWTGYSPIQGYGRYKINQENWPAHQYSYYLANGTLPHKKTHVIMHSCDNPPCVNPQHLKVGTHKDNSEDMINKNRHRKGEEINLAKLREIEVKIIRKLYKLAPKLYPSRKLARIFNVKKGAILNIVNYQTWKHVA